MGERIFGIGGLQGQELRVKGEEIGLVCQSPCGFDIHVCATYC